MQVRKCYQKIVVFLVVLVMGISIGAIAFVSANTQNDPSKSPVPDYPKNKSGLTYGSSLYSPSQDKDPDLIKAYGVDGTLGYVRSKDLHNDVVPKTPEEALAQQAKDSVDKEIPLYDVEGKKVIGKFRISSSDSSNKIK